MATLKTTIRTPSVVRTIVRGLGRSGLPGANGINGAPGPNIVTPETQSTLGNGIVASDNGLIRLATNAEIVSEAELTAALANRVVDTDPRLSDARKPLAHTHTISDITGLAPFIDQMRIASIYRPADRGIAWDLDRIETLWQNSTATIPVTAYGDPVGRIEDVSGRGIAWIQATSSRRPTYARRPKSGIRNLLQRTDDLTNAYWVKTNSTTPNAHTWAINSGVTIQTGALGIFTSGTTCVLRNSVLLPLTATSHTFSVEAKIGSVISHLQARVSTAPLLSAAADRTTIVRLTDGAVVLSDGTTVVTNLGDGWYRIAFTFTPVAGNYFVGFWLWNSTSRVANGTESILIRNLQLEIGSVATNYQRATNQFDVTEVGQQSINYLWCDGIDDCMQSAGAIDFSNSDEMTICLGQRKLSDSAQRTLIELGNSIDANNASVQLTAPNAATPTYAYRSRGTTLQTEEATGFPQPDFCLLTAQSDISADLLTLRRNATQVATNAGDQGTGNYANAILHLGSRAGSSQFFSGHINSGFIINRILHPTQLIDVERNWVAAKAGIDL